MATDPAPSSSTGPRPASPVATSSSERVHSDGKPVSKRGTSGERPTVAVTRAGMVWVAVTAGLAVLVLLIIFILQNEDRVTVHYLGAAGELSLGMALFISAVGGGILVAIAGAARILQLRSQRRHPKDVPSVSSGPTATEGPRPTS